MELYARRKPFAMVKLPGREAELRELTGHDGSKSIFGNIEIFPWEHDLPREQYPDNLASSTSREEYISGLERLIGSYEDDKVKTVIVRKIVGGLPAAFNSPETFGKRLQAYFDSFPNAMQFAFYTPQCGLWLGSSPELLLETKPGERIELQALAGTRKAGTDRPWDAKNIMEHGFVVDDMVRTLEERFDVTATPTYSMNYGHIEHLCKRIIVKAPMDKVDEIVKAVHPTPAICGTPRREAIDRIHAVERFPREFYTGIISVADQDARAVYVILRCAHIDGAKYQIFTGSGIVSDSDPASEWDETQAKAKPLIELFS